MDPGHYIIVASTQRPNQPGEFFLRVYAKKGNTLGYAEVLYIARKRKYTGMAFHTVLALKVLKKSQMNDNFMGFFFFSQAQALSL